MKQHVPCRVFPLSQKLEKNICTNGQLLNIGRSLSLRVVCQGLLQQIRTTGNQDKEFKPNKIIRFYRRKETLVIFSFFAYLHISSEGFICILEAVPVLSSQSERDPWQAEGTVFGYLCIHRLGSCRVGHREVLIQQLLGDDILQTEAKIDESNYQRKQQSKGKR